MTSALTSTWSDSSRAISDVFRDIITTTLTRSFTVTPPPTRRSTGDFVYVDYDEYSEYSSYEDSSGLNELPGTPTTTDSNTITTQTAPTHVFRKNSPTMPPAAVTMETVDTEDQTPALVWTSAIPEFSTTSSPDPGDNTTSSGGRSLQSQVNLTEAEPELPSSSFFSLSKKENNSVDEVQYQIVGLDSDVSRGQQNYFVPRMPQVHERTHNKRIQQLLNEKRRQDLLRRQSRIRASRTDRKH